MAIPIRNLYYIFCYAWSRFPDGEAADVGEENCPDLQNLFAKLLIEGMHGLIRRGMDRGYVEVTEDTRSPRGRLLLDEMIKRQTMLRGEAACRYDELQIDILHNQILKATARLLAKSKGLLPVYRHELGILARRLEAVSDIRLTSSTFRRVQLSRNSRQYRLLMRLCEFVFHSSLPEENGSGSRFADILDDEVRMSSVFEDFLRNFYAHEQSAFTVKRDIMAWDAVPLTDGAAVLLPTLETDVTLHSRDRVIIFEAKYYKDPLEGRPGFPRKLRSNHLRQLFTYMHHMALRYTTKQVDGILIYPTVGTELSADYLISGRNVRAITIDLNRQWPEIHNELLSIPAWQFTASGRQFDSPVAAQSS